ncbi:P-loop containing nucleoside triphosphate hydrolase protein [Lentinula boryana]|uniref:P-loop containing nucleoside triphosphate hydrolase protein n=1 Tax=Lentinula boryana TaxID=40481 RepID=A0ABQ8Q3Q8_9AGAR|nr:P-loop containing nucleoside triphosphate hydrolase protein [Lentinula boryana]
MALESSFSVQTSLLGKRSRQLDQDIEQLQTPGPSPNPKRAKATTTPVLDDDGNKENVPPLSVTPVNTSPPSSRAIRALRRSTTLERFVTPPPARATIKRNASFSTSFANMTLATPPATPLTLLPFHARVRALLRATCNNNVSMPARDTERDIILKFIRGFLSHSETDALHSLYISGSPGCGKTALMSSILDSLQLDGTRIINVNCMALTNFESLWDRLIDEFDGVLQKKRKSGITKGNSREVIESLLSGMTSQCILVLDEMDHLASNPQSISSFFNLAKSDKLCVIGIANTHTLTSSLSASSDGFRTLHFSPYTSAQLLQIMQSRLSTLTTPDQLNSDSGADINRFFPLPTLTLLAKKVAGLTGDVRTLFEALRGAIDLAVTSSATTQVDDDEIFFAKASPVCSVTPAHVLAALKTVTQAQASRQTSTQSLSTPARTTSNSGIVQKVASLGLQARLVLLSVLITVKRIETGLSIDLSTSRTSSNLSHRNASKSLATDKTVVVDSPHLYAFYSYILRRGGDASISTPVSRTEFSDLLGMLEGVGLVALGSFQSSPKKRVCLGRSMSSGKSGNTFLRSRSTLTEEVRLAPGIWVDEVLRGLGVACSKNTTASQDIKEEELNAIWLKEDAVIRKELKAVENKRNVHEGNQMFVDASLDN